MTDNSPSRDTFNTPSFPTISDYDGLEQNSHGHNTLETNLIVSALLLSQAYRSSHRRCSVARGVIKKRLWQRCFPVNFAKFLRTPFVTKKLWTTASEPNSMKDLLCKTEDPSFYFKFK